MHASLSIILIFIFGFHDFAVWVPSFEQILSYMRFR